MFRLTVTLALVAACGQVVLAQPSPSIVANQDYFNATRYIGARNTARTVDGNIIVAFEPASNYVNTEIWYVTWNTFFDEWDPPQQLSFSPGSSTGIPALVADDDGNIWASWKQLNQEGDRDMAAAVWNGAAWSAPMVADNIVNNSGVGTIDIAADGTIFNLFSIWNDPAEYEANIYSSHTSDGGENWLTENLTDVFPTPDFLPLNFMDVSLCPGPNGTMVAAWEDKPYDDSWEIMFSSYADESWSQPEVISPIEDQLGTLKYVDGCTPADGAQAIYEMGPAGYALEGAVSAILNPDPTHPAFSSFFNLRYVGEESVLDELTSDVISFFDPEQILVVDDDNRYDHSGYLTESLDRLSLPYTVYDCGQDSTGVEQIPESQDLDGQDLVIWFCGDDGGSLALWNEAEEDNSALINYLDGGGALWVLGIDWLFDRYPATPTVFSEGDFCYDYLGIASYDVQSWSDDANTGVEQLLPVAGQTLTDAGTITWSVTGAIRQGEPSLASTTDGLLHMSYVEDGHVYYMTSTNGTNWSQPIQLDNSPDSLNCARPCTAADADNGIYVTWNQEQTLQPRLTNIFYTTSPDGGNNWNSPLQLSQAEEGNDFGNSVFKASIGRKVRPEIPGTFEGGADVIWVQWNAQSELGYDIMYGRIPYVGNGTAVEDRPTQPRGISLVEIYPNPFNPSTEIQFELVHAAHTRIEIVNLRGAVVEVLADGPMDAGAHTLRWNAEAYASGVYLLHLRAGDEHIARKLSLLR